jgi:hypothetical protein
VGLAIRSIIGGRCNADVNGIFVISVTLRKDSRMIRTRIYHCPGSRSRMFYRAVLQFRAPSANHFIREDQYSHYEVGSVTADSSDGISYL